MVDANPTTATGSTGHEYQANMAFEAAGTTTVGLATLPEIPGSVAVLNLVTRGHGNVLHFSHVAADMVLLTGTEMHDCISELLRETL
jgi:hypothetical protein